jgi:hypothetical protein
MSEKTNGRTGMDEVKKRADEAAEAPENVAARDRNQRQGVDDSRPAKSHPHGS